MSFDLSSPSGLTLALGPDLFLMVAAMFAMLWAAWGPDSPSRQRSTGYVSVVLAIVTFGIIVWYGSQATHTNNGIIAVDNFRWASDLIILTATILTILLSIEYNDREGITAGESHVLILFATSGMMLLAAARDLMLVFLGIELMSVAIYVLAGLNRRSERSAEGALKYFLLGAFSTGFLLYGIALIYGATATTNLAEIAMRIGANSLTSSPLLLIGIALLMIGFGFKVAAVPFHMWAPDVYEGAPTPITAFMAAAVKAGAFAAFVRIWMEAFGDVSNAWHLPLAVLAAVTMVVGNLVALAQRNIKRMLAYSSIAHAGYVLVAVVSGTALGSWAFLFYLFSYTLATMGAFGVVIAFGNAGERNLTLDDYAGLWRVRPALATAMAVFMLALLGFPIFGGMGFFAKWYVIEAAWQSPRPLGWLIFILVLTSVASAGYYLEVVRTMFMRPRAEGAEVPLATGNATRFVIAVSVLLVLGFGVWPNMLVQWTQHSAPGGVPVATASPGLQAQLP